MRDVITCLSVAVVLIIFTRQESEPPQAETETQPLSCSECKDASFFSEKLEGVMYLISHPTFVPPSLLMDRGLLCFRMVNWRRQPKHFILEMYF